MPGMMDTVLNLGLNDISVEGVAKKTNNPRFAWDSYRRFIAMFGNVVKGIPGEHWEHVLAGQKAKKGVKLDNELEAEDLKEVVKGYKAVYKTHVKEDFPQEPKKTTLGGHHCSLWKLEQLTSDQVPRNQ
jgi:pyruvate,orthophosphate dikinase